MRIQSICFFPLLQTTAPDLIDYHMPENAGFHNLILAKTKTLYKGHAKQTMHAFWGVGQMSFVKHAIFVDEKAPDLENYEEFSRYVLNHFSPKSMFITEGILDALDHSSNESLVGGKLGIDATQNNASDDNINILEDKILFEKIKTLLPDAQSLKQYMKDTKNPLTVISVTKKQNIKYYFEALQPLEQHLRIVVFIDEMKNDINNPYMLIWRVSNNIDAMRDIFTHNLMVGIDGTNKNHLDNFSRKWPGDVECTKNIITSLKNKGVWSLTNQEETYYQL